MLAKQNLRQICCASMYSQKGWWNWPQVKVDVYLSIKFPFFLVKKNLSMILILHMVTNTTLTWSHTHALYTHSLTRWPWKGCCWTHTHTHTHIKMYTHKNVHTHNQAYVNAEKTKKFCKFEMNKISIKDNTWNWKFDIISGGGWGII